LDYHLDVFQHNLPPMAITNHENPALDLLIFIQLE